MSQPPLILASGSPRRLALLEQMGVVPNKVVAPEIDETAHKQELPRLYAMRMAQAKLQAVKTPDAFVLAADTVVACGRRIVPKAADGEAVASSLKLLSGRSHQVLTAICATGPKDERIAKRLVVTRVIFKRLCLEEIDTYVKSGQGIGKAGGYAIQGLAGQFVKRINGSYSAVVGLPLFETYTVLSGLGYRTNGAEV